jgi:hypothetical protein
LIALGLSGQAWAICAGSSFVFDFSVTELNGTWTYDYSVENGCAPNQQQLLTDFYLPYFADAGIANITVPAQDNSAIPAITWSYSKDANNDLFGLGAGVIDFHVTSTTDVSPTLSLPGVGYYGSSGFSFTSSFAPVKGPYALLQTAYAGGLYDSTTLLFGDPSIPGSPDTVSALSAAATPEPGTMGSLAIVCFMTAFTKLGPLALKRWK